jgi:hypothetical protein
MKTQLAIFLVVVVGALAQQSQVSTSTTWCATRPVVVVDGNFEFYGADCITLMRCPTNSIVLAGYDSTPQPQQFPAGIESPSIGLAQTNGSVVGIAVTPALDVIGYLDHASPRTGWEQRRDAAIASNQVKMTALRALKSSPEYSSLTNQLAQYDGHYATLTNLIATADLTKTNKVQDIMTKQRQATDDLHDALVKAVKLIKDLAGNQ